MSRAKAGKLLLERGCMFRKMIPTRLYNLHGLVMAVGNCALPRPLMKSASLRFEQLAERTYGWTMKKCLHSQCNANMRRCSNPPYIWGAKNIVIFLLSQ